MYPGLVVGDIVVRYSKSEACEVEGQWEDVPLGMESKYKGAFPSAVTRSVLGTHFKKIFSDCFDER